MFLADFHNAPRGMRLFTFLHAADIHLDSPLRGLERYDGAPVEEIRNATRQAFENLVSLALEEQVAFVLIAGDLYDSDWKDYNTGLFFAGQMNRLREAKIEVVVVRGNHDAKSSITRVLSPPPNVRFLSSSQPETVVFEDLGVTVVGQSYPKRVLTEDLSADYPNADGEHLTIGMLHTSVDGREGHEPYAPCKVSDLVEKGYDYWALGHIHQREVLHEDPWIVFPGCLQGRHIREVGAKGCSLVTVEDERIVGVEHRELDVVRWALCRVDVSEASSGDDVIELTRDVIREVVDDVEAPLIAVRVELTGATEAHRDLSTNPARWTNEIRAVAINFENVWIEKVRLATTARADLDEMRRRDDVIGHVLRAFDSLEQGGENEVVLDDDVAALIRKLPPELGEGGDSIDPFKNEELFRQALGDVRQLILAHFLASEEG